MRMLARLALFTAALTLSTAAALAGGNPIVRFQTDLGNVDVVLLEDIAPNTVANFLRYVNRHAYDNSFIHRSVPNFVIQGGGYKYINNNVETIPQDPPVANEFHVSNTRGTLAMAKLGGDPNSATNQWFFNQVDNSANLDSQNGGFTVFGRIVGSSGLSVLDAIGALPTYNFGSPFDSLPLRNYSSGGVQDSNLIHVISAALYRTSLTLSRPSANQIHLQASGTPGASYRLETFTAANGANFVLTATLTADPQGNIAYDDNNPGPRKLYRLTLP